MSMWWTAVQPIVGANKFREIFFDIRSSVNCQADKVVLRQGVVWRLTLKRLCPHFRTKFNKKLLFFVLFLLLLFFKSERKPISLLWAARRMNWKRTESCIKMYTRSLGAGWIHVWTATNYNSKANLLCVPIVHSLISRWRFSLHFRLRI